MILCELCGKPTRSPRTPTKLKDGGNGCRRRHFCTDPECGHVTKSVHLTAGAHEQIIERRVAERIQQLSESILLALPAIVREVVRIMKYDEKASKR